MPTPSRFHQRELLKQTEKTLLTHARSHWTGSRRNLKRIVRRYVRRYKHHPGFLRRVLHSTTVAASTALLLLHMHATPLPVKAATNPITFTPLTGSSLGHGGGYESLPTFADLDDDGDQDIVVVDGYGNFHYFENTRPTDAATGTLSTFTGHTGAANPLNGITVYSDHAPSFADLDGDGDQDLVVVDQSGVLHYFENTSGTGGVSFTERTGSANPLDAADDGISTATPTAFADLDGDGDQDFFLGHNASALAYFENTRPTNAASGTLSTFTELTGSANPLNGHTANFVSFVDLDNDGDLDAAGQDGNGALYFENTGTSSAPSLTKQTGTANPFSTYIAQSIDFTDLDGDGDQDYITGSSDRDIFFFEHTTSTSTGGTLPVFTEQTGTANPLEGISVGPYNRPALVDLDGDGNVDLVSGDETGVFHYFRNTGSSSSPDFVKQTGTANPLEGISVGGYSSPSFVDLDGDGNIDLVSGDKTGVFHYFRNTGSSSSPDFVKQTGGANPLEGKSVYAYSTPSFVDLDGDGDLDMVSGVHYSGFNSYFTYFENTTGTDGPSFTAVPPSSNPLYNSGAGDSGYPTSAFADLDGDGDLDVVTGEFSQPISFLENTGTSVSPSFTGSTAVPLAGNNTYGGAPAFADLDGDGDLDLISANNINGTFRYFENNPSTSGGGDNGNGGGTGGTLPTFEQQTGSANPLNELLVEYDDTYSAPVFLDLDGDGDLDMVSGQDNGRFSYFENTTPTDAASGTLPTFTAQVSYSNPFSSDVGEDSHPALVDLNGDGDLDMVSGAKDGTFTYFVSGRSSNGALSFSRFIGGGSGSPLDPVADLDVGSLSTPAFADLDGDGDQDMISGAADGTFHYFENTSPTDPTTQRTFIEQTGTANPLNGQNVGSSHSTPSFADLDGDGDQDVVSGAADGKFDYFENTRPTDASPGTPSIFVKRTGTADPLDGKQDLLFNKPTFADLDGDGDLDLITGNSVGSFSYFENNPSTSGGGGTGGGSNVGTGEIPETGVTISGSRIFLEPNESARTDGSPIELTVTNNSGSAIGGLQFAIDLNIGQNDIATFNTLDGTDADLNPDLYDDSTLPSGFEARAVIDDGALKVVLFTQSGATIQAGQAVSAGRIPYTLAVLDPPGTQLPASEILGEEKYLSINLSSFTLVSDDTGIKIDEVHKIDGGVLAGIRGDVNLDTSVDVRDVVILVKEILTETLPDDQAADKQADLAIRDANEQGDGINVTDAVAVILRILGQDPTTATPPASRLIASGPVDASLGAMVQLADGSLAIPVVLGSQGVAGLQAELSFDPSLVRLGTPQLADGAGNLMLDHHIEDGRLRLIALSLTGETLPAGRAVLIPVTQIGNGAATLELTDMTLSSPWAQTLAVQLGQTTQPVSGKGSSLPGSFALSAAQPNPFNPATTIAYEVPEAAHVQLTVYNLLGQEVIRLVDEVRQPGRYQITWNALNARGAQVSSGVYLYRLTSSTGFADTQRMTLLK